MIALVAASVLALVTQDRAAIRAEPREGAPRVATLWEGEVLEARRSSRGYLEVWDHRRERGGWVRVTQVRGYAVAPESVPELLAIVRFLRDTPGSEALGVAHAALALKAGDPATVGGELFDAIGTMSDRLASRASSPAADEVVTAHLEVVASYGVKMRAVSLAEGRARLCADGEAWQRSLALARTAAMQLRAVLALTAPECVDGTSEAARRTSEVARAALLDRVDPAQLTPDEAQKLRIRRAGVWATIAFDRARASDGVGSAEAGERALSALAGVDRAAMADDDKNAYADAAIRVGASRWAASTAVVPDRGLRVIARAGPSAGETCLELGEGARTVLVRCTFGQPWLASQVVAPGATALALAVSPLPGWRELWVFKKNDATWSVDVLAPSSAAPELGYVEHAGWSTDGSKMLVAREAREGRERVRSFEVIGIESLVVEAQGPRPPAAFARWRSAEWKSGTIALR